MSKRLTTPIAPAPDPEPIPDPDAPPPGPRVYATREDILTADDLRREDVWCPEWDRWVCIRAMSGPERALWDDMLIANKDEVARGGDPISDTQVFQARLVTLTAIDPVTGALLFQPDDRFLLDDKNAVPVYRCYTVAARLCKLRKQDVDELTATLGKGGNSFSGSA